MKAIFVCIALSLPASLSAETYTMTTYYPSPAGVYTDLTVTSGAVLARNGGSVTIGGAAAPGRLSVNGETALSGPATINGRTDVNNGLFIPPRFADDPGASYSPVNGAIYFNTTSQSYRVYANGAWTDLVSAMPPLTSDEPCDSAHSGKMALGLSVCEMTSTGPTGLVSTTEYECIRKMACKLVPGGGLPGLKFSVWQWVVP